MEFVYSFRMKEKNVKSKTAKAAKNKKSEKVAKATNAENVENAALVKNNSVDSAALVVPANDSAAVLDAGIVADSLNAGESAPELALPTAEQLGISITAGTPGATLTATAGDTINFPVTVSWSVNGSAILVVPTSTANAKGILQLGVSQESSRMVKDGKELAQITFNYKLLVQDTGNLNIPAMRFEIPTPMGQSLDLRSDSVPLRSDAPVSILPIVVGVVVALCLIAAGVWRVRRRAAAQAVAAKRSAAENALREKMIVLKQRVMVADSREWLLELESVCNEYAFEKFGAAGTGAAAASAVNLDALLANDKLDGWKPLLEEFAHARYGGGKRDSFENKETWKLAMTLMGVNEE